MVMRVQLEFESEIMENVDERKWQAHVSVRLVLKSTRDERICAQEVRHIALIVEEFGSGCPTHVKRSGFGCPSRMRRLTMDIRLE